MVSTRERYILEVILDMGLIVFLVVCAADLLYLYSIGRWYDLNKVIEYSEVAMLVVFVVAGTVRLVYKFRYLRRLGR